MERAKTYLEPSEIDGWPAVTVLTVAANALRETGKTQGARGRAQCERLAVRLEGIGRLDEIQRAAYPLPRSSPSVLVGETE